MASDARNYETLQPSFDVEFPLADLAIVAVSGETDLQTVSDFDGALRRASDMHNVLVDFTGCAFIDSSMIGVLVAAFHRFQEDQRRLELIIPPEARTIRRAMKVMGIDAIVPTHTARAEALASIGI